MDKNVNDIELKELLSDIKKQVSRLNWSKDDFTRYLNFVYGKTSLMVMSEEQLWDCLEYLASLPNGAIPPCRQPSFLRIKKIEAPRITPLTLVKWNINVEEYDSNNYPRF